MCGQPRQQGWRSPRALASHQCDPGSFCGLGVISGLSLLVLYSAPRGFSPGTLVFPSPQKTFDLICVELQMFTLIRTSKDSIHLQYLSVEITTNGKSDFEKNAHKGKLHITLHHIPCWLTLSIHQQTLEHQFPQHYCKVSFPKAQPFVARRTKG